MSFENPGFFEEMRMEWLWNRLGSSRYRKYIRGLHLRSDEKALDFGCGGGSFSKHIAKEVPNGSLVCLDTSDFWLEKAKKRMKEFSNVEYICKKIEYADLPDNYFDSVFIHFVLHDIPENNRQQVIDALAGKLIKNGHIYIREPTRKDHGMLAAEVDRYMNKAGLSKISGVHGSYFRWPHYTAVFRK
ncbi:MAG: class I SAM-dependent methyltransferase [Methanosarcinaceae archaeon]|nr:class I SAM-dependent methyltransferase [Methanosarcinaceae archaeon]